MQLWLRECFFHKEQLISHGYVEVLLTSSLGLLKVNKNLKRSLLTFNKPDERVMSRYF